MRSDLAGKLVVGASLDPAGSIRWTILFSCGVVCVWRICSCLMSRQCRGWIVVVASLPIRDRVGNALVDVRFGAEEGLACPVRRSSMPASLVVVIHAKTVLMMFDSWRKEWELPGGSREHGETARQARCVNCLRRPASRRWTCPSPRWPRLIRRPERRELLAIYELHLQVVPRLTVNDEALDFRWWSPTSPVDDAMSPLDAEIARRVLHFSAN